VYDKFHFLKKGVIFGVMSISTKEQALKTFEKYYEAWENDPRRMDSGYQYEASYAEMMKKVGKEVFQTSTGKVPKGVNSKKNSKRNLEK